MARKRDEGALRTASGRKSRSKESLGLEERLILDAATWKRRQMNPKLTISEARLPEHGSVIALWLEMSKASKRRTSEPQENVFTQMHYDTALRYHELHERWLAICGARRQRSSSDFTGPGGYDGADPFEATRADREARTQADYKEARAAVLASGPLGMMAVETIVIENKPAERLRGDLRLALNALAVLWKLQAAA